MKTKRSTSIKVKTFAVFAIFTAIMLVLLWLLQTVFLEEIYRSIKLTSVEECANTALKTDSPELIEGLSERYDVCIKVVDTLGIEIESAHHNSSCIVHRLTIPTIMQIGIVTAKSGGEALHNVSLLDFMDMGHEGYRFNNGSTPKDRSETIIYSKVSGEKLVLVEAVISPVGATIDTLRIELYCVTAIMIVIGFILALFFSKTLSKPIQKLNESAKLLSKGEYNIDFTTNGYREVEELGNTLNYAEGELSKVDDLRKELLANISHDLRTPLTMISGYAEVMRDIPGEQTPENVQVIIDEATRLTTLVNDLLDLSRLQAGRETLVKETYCITDAVEELLLRYNKLVMKDGYNITFDYDTKVLVNADRHKIDQVIYNLINNAVNYTGADKLVAIKQTVIGKKVRLTVTDTGEGIAEDKLNAIWDRYYKLDKTHKRAQIGTGLGLSIVRGVVELHGGSYGVSSKVGCGSTFWFEIDAQ